MKADRIDGAYQEQSYGFIRTIMQRFDLGSHVSVHQEPLTAQGAIFPNQFRVGRIE